MAIYIYKKKKKTGLFIILTLNNKWRRIKIVAFTVDEWKKILLEISKKSFYISDW